MERVIINNIIQQFNQVGPLIKADKQVLFLLPFNGMVKKFERKRPPDVIFGNPMLKRRLAECDDKYHALHFDTAAAREQPARCTCGKAVAMP
ncbi:MAG: hypothetical protein LBH18_01805 [Spirochaetaceae bacterium]|nr:hypothetical protein [Spirochaetaceae bacterium]